MAPPPDCSRSQNQSLCGPGWVSRERVHNTLPYPVTAPLSIESGPYFVPDADFRNTRGQSIDIQEVSPSVRCDVRHWEFVDTLPARGCNTYHFSDTLS